MGNKINENKRKETTIVIRADGNADIGAGHLMRCLTIAERVRERGHVVFWCADEASAALAQDRGYEARALGTDYRDMSSELPRLEDLMHGMEQSSGMKKKGTILVDSYYATEEYLQALRAYGRVFLLEDMPGHIWPVDGVINYNAFADLRYYEEIYEKNKDPLFDSDVKQNTKLYIGASYIPVRSQFAGYDYQARGQVKELLVTTGGGDRENIAGKILERLECMQCHIHVVSGPYNPHRQWLDNYARTHPRVVVHRQVEEMARLMLQCDLAVTAGGTTVYELCALGVPFVCFSYAENQEMLAEYVSRQKIGLNAGRYHRDSGETLYNIGNLVRRAAAEPQLRRQMSRRARKLVDGQGARRLADALLEAGREENLNGCQYKRS